MSMTAVLSTGAAEPAPPATDAVVAAAHANPATSTRLATLSAPASPVATLAPLTTPAPVPAPMATVAGAELFVPAPDAAAVGFHQGGSSNLAMSPSGQHVVMASRHRGTSSTSAVDIAVGDDRAVTSPVAGTVSQVEDYSLYGKHPDVLVTIVPDGTDVAVRMMHIADVTVEPGDRVEPGDPIAEARPLPVRSQVDRHHDGTAGPHVHLDVSAR